MINIDSIPKYCINLPQDLLKKEWMRRMIKFIDLKNIQYVQAIDFSKIELPKVQISIQTDIGLQADTEPQAETVEFDLSRLKASLGCLFSHKAIFEHALSNNFDWIMVMEDDVGFNKNFKKDAIALNFIPQNADFISLNKCKITLSHNKFFDELLYFSHINAYIINTKLMTHFIDRLESIDLWGEDISFLQFMCNTVFENGCNAYSVKKPLVYVDFQKLNSKIADYSSPAVLDSEIKQTLFNAASQHKFI